MLIGAICSQLDPANALKRKWAQQIVHTGRALPVCWVAPRDLKNAADLGRRLILSFRSSVAV